MTATAPWPRWHLSQPQSSIMNAAATYMHAYFRPGQARPVVLFQSQPEDACSAGMGLHVHAVIYCGTHPTGHWPWPRNHLCSKPQMAHDDACMRRMVGDDVAEAVPYVRRRYCDRRKAHLLSICHQLQGAASTVPTRRVHVKRCQ